VDDTAGAQEQQPFEEGVGDQMKDRTDEATDTGAKEHIAELTDGRIRQHAFDIVLDQADAGGENRRQTTDNRDEFGGDWRQLVQNVTADHHIHPGRDHGRRVDEGTHRCRTFHSIWQPDVERDLGRFPHGPDEQAEGDGGEDRRADFRRALEDVQVGKGVKGRVHQEHAQEESGVADPIDDKGLLSGIGGRFALKPKADE
jgi:hypothetical protein